MNKIIVEQLGIEESEITLKSRIIEDLGGDSLDVVEIVMLVEEEFDLEIPDDVADTADTVNNIVEYVTLNVK